MSGGRGVREGTSAVTTLNDLVLLLVSIISVEWQKGDSNLSEERGHVQNPAVQLQLRHVSE